MSRDELLELLRNDQEVRDAIFKHNTEAEVQQAQELQKRLNSGIVKSIENRLESVGDHRG